MAIRAATARAGPGYTHPRRAERAAVPARHGRDGARWKDTGGSQFFITHSPQPHLDAKYTVFGRVVNGMDVVDRIQAGDVIQRVRVWDGLTMRVSRRAARSSYKQKRGRRAPPFFTGEAGLPLLAGLLLPALGCFLCHCAHPPLHCGIQIARSSHRSRGPLPPGTSACRLPAPVASAANPRVVTRESQHLKNWGCQLSTPPVVRRKRLALLPARLLLSALCSLLSHDSSLEFGSSAIYRRSDLQQVG